MLDADISMTSAHQWSMETVVSTINQPFKSHHFDQQQHASSVSSISCLWVLVFQEFLCPPLHRYHEPQKDLLNTLWVIIGSPSGSMIGEEEKSEESEFLWERRPSSKFPLFGRVPTLVDILCVWEHILMFPIPSDNR